MWPRRLASSKECVTTHGPNLRPSKMDGADADKAESTPATFVWLCRGACHRQRISASLRGRRAGGSADLGCSSEHPAMSWRLGWSRAPTPTASVLGLCGSQHRAEQALTAVLRKAHFGVQSLRCRWKARLDERVLHRRGECSLRTTLL